MRFCTSGYDLCYVPVGTGIDPLEVWIMIRYNFGFDYEASGDLPTLRRDQASGSESECQKVSRSEGPRVSKSEGCEGPEDTRA